MLSTNHHIIAVDCERLLNLGALSQPLTALDSPLPQILHMQKAMGQFQKMNGVNDWCRLC